MSVLVTFNIECDWPGCFRQSCGVVGRLVRGRLTITAHEARENAERGGFSRRKLPNGEMGDVCWEHRRGNGT